MDTPNSMPPRAANTAERDEEAQAKRENRETKGLAAMAEADAAALVAISTAAEDERVRSRTERDRLGTAADVIARHAESAERMADARARYQGWSVEDSLRLEAAGAADADFDVAAVRRHYAAPVEPTVPGRGLTAEDVTRHYLEGGKPVTQVVGKPKAKG